MKINRTIGLLTISCALVLGACNKTPFVPYQTTAKVNAGAMINSEKKDGYDFVADYDENYFLNDTTKYSEDLALLSYVASIASSKSVRGTDFYTDLKFNDILPNNYEEAPTKDSAAYFFAHKAIDDHELFIVSFRGTDYGQEWANNFLIGKTGDHEGFSLRANEVYLNLSKYIETHANNRPVKLWISGYSRGGALANVLSNLVIRGDKIKVEQKNIYAYTFEAPNCLEAREDDDFACVHNVLNKGDFITEIPPESYGLTKCGVNHYLDATDVSAIMHQFDEDIAFPEFVKIEAETDINNEEQLAKYVIESVFNAKDSEGADISEHTANTREQYADRYQEGVCYILELLFKLAPLTLNSILSDLQSKSMMELLLILGDETGGALKDLLKTYLDKDKVQYDEEKLLSASQTLLYAVTNLFLKVILIYLNENYRPSLTRTLYMHYPEVNYALLKAEANK